MQIPLLQHAAGLAQALPLPAAVRRRPRGAMAWIVAWCAINPVEDLRLFAPAYEFQGAVSVAAFLAIGWEVWCPRAA